MGLFCYLYTNSQIQQSTVPQRWGSFPKCCGLRLFLFTHLPVTLISQPIGALETMIDYFLDMRLTVYILLTALATRQIGIKHSRF